jgi:pSer/pThr/pTyr-binding forkhead associated (FHA) protein
MVTIGRVPNNDIVLGFPTISKVHAYLLRKNDAWWLFDQRSTNGIYVNRVRLAPGGSAPLEDGVTVNLGPSLALTFMVPGTLYGFMRGPLLPRRG